MKNKVLITIFIVFLTALMSSGGTYLYLDFRKTKKENKEAKEKLENLQKELDSLTKAPNEQPNNEKETGKGKKETEKKSQSGQTIVTKPLDNETIGNPVTISGRAVAFESQVNIRIKDANGKVLKETNTMTDAKDAGQFGNFSASVSYPSPATDTGTIEVYQVSMADGGDSEKDKVTISVKFK